MTDEAWIGVLAGSITLINGLWAVIMRGVKSELRTFRAENQTQFALITSKIDLHVIERLDRVEGEVGLLRKKSHANDNACQRNSAKIDLLEQRVDQLEGKNGGHR